MQDFRYKGLKIAAPFCCNLFFMQFRKTAANCKFSVRWHETHESRARAQSWASNATFNFSRARIVLRGGCVVLLFGEPRIFVLWTRSNNTNPASISSVQRLVEHFGYLLTILLRMCCGYLGYLDCLPSGVTLGKHVFTFEEY